MPTPTLDTPPQAVSMVGGRKVIMLGSHNHLGLNGDPRVTAAAQRAVDRYGTAHGPGLGDTPLHAELETEIADWLQAESAVVCSTVAVANAACLAALSDPAWPVMTHRPHTSDQHPNRRGHRPVVHGGLDPWQAPGPPAAGPLVVDESSTLGLVGPAGAGIRALRYAARDVCAQTGSLDRALGAGGAFIAGSAELIAYVREQLRALPYAAPVPSATLGAALMAVRITRSADGARRRDRLMEHTHRIRESLITQGYPVRDPPRLPNGRHLYLPEVVIEVADTTTVHRLWHRLYHSGVYVRWERYPDTPTDRAELHVALMATHTTGQLATAIDAFAAALNVLGRRRRAG